jgi:hypothetical protein
MASNSMYGGVKKTVVKKTANVSIDAAKQSIGVMRSIPAGETPTFTSGVTTRYSGIPPATTKPKAGPGAVVKIVPTNPKAAYSGPPKATPASPLRKKSKPTPKPATPVVPTPPKKKPPTRPKPALKVNPAKHSLPVKGK